MAICYCSRCRKAQTADFGTYFHTNLESFNWKKGKEEVHVFQPKEGDARPFCKTCGCRTPIIEEEDDHVIIPSGLLDGDPQLKPIAHLYVGSRAPWVEIKDDVAQFEEDAPKEFWFEILQEFQSKKKK